MSMLTQSICLMSCQWIELQFSLIEILYLTRCLTNLSWLLTEGVFLWMTGVWAYLKTESKVSAKNRAVQMCSKQQHKSLIMIKIIGLHTKNRHHILTFWSPRYLIISFSQYGLRITLLTRVTICNLWGCSGSPPYFSCSFDRSANSYE